MTIRATHRSAGPPTSDQQLADFFGRLGLCAPALNPEGVGGRSSSPDSDGRLIRGTIVAFPGEHDSGAKDRARRTSAVTAWENTAALIALVPAHHLRTLQLIYDPTLQEKPMLRLLDNAPAKQRLGPFRMLIDETRAMRHAWGAVLAASEEKAQTRTDDATQQRQARAAGIQHGELHDLRQQMRVAEVGDIEVALTAEELAMRKRERKLERTLEYLVAATRQQAQVVGLHAFIVAIDGTRKGEKALLAEARAECEARAGEAWDAWLDVRGRRTQVRGPVDFKLGAEPTDWMQPREPETESE